MFVVLLMFIFTIFISLPISRSQIYFVILTSSSRNKLLDIVNTLINTILETDITPFNTDGSDVSITINSIFPMKNCVNK